MLPSYTPPTEPSLPDVLVDLTFCRSVEFVKEHGATSGYQEGTYHPEWTVNRAQMAVFLAKAFGLTM